MLGESLGEYLVVKKLGTGSMGTVYLATEQRDRGMGRRVALKVIHPHLVSRENVFRRFQREAEAGRRVRHENVVSILDLRSCEVDGDRIHYLVMEHVEGRDLESLRRELGTCPEALLREVAEQVAAGLAAIHVAGIVHRDLKPENILITDEHRIRIMDLGVARLTEKTAGVTEAGHFVGSPLYASPEQFETGEVGPAADLYSFGVVLFELATGQNPFRRDDIPSVIAAHQSFVPPPAADLNPALSPFFSSIIASLLSKQPDRRFESAAELRLALAAGEASRWWCLRERERFEEGDRTAQIPVPRTGGLHGRTTELELLGHAWSRTEQGRGTTLLVQGEPGIGKTSLVHEFVRKLSFRDFHLLYGAFAPEGGLGSLCRALLSFFGSEELEPRVRALLRDAPAYADVLLEQVDCTDSGRLENPTRSAMTGEAFRFLAQALATEKPVLWVVEDLDHARPDHLELVGRLTESTLENRVLLLLTGGMSLSRWELTKSLGSSGFQSLVLTRLGPDAVAAMLEELLGGEELSGRYAEGIALRSDGNPWLAGEMISCLRRSGCFLDLADGSTTTPDAAGHAPPCSREGFAPCLRRGLVPCRIRQSILSRTTALSREEKDLLSLAAMAGPEFDPILLAGASSLARLQALRTLASIERRSGLICSIGRRYRFDYPLVQEVLAADLPEAERRELRARLDAAREEE
jgi:predicted Ser/Thr protein kinase